MYLTIGWLLSAHRWLEIGIRVIFKKKKKKEKEKWMFFRCKTKKKMQQLTWLLRQFLGEKFQLALKKRRRNRKANLHKRKNNRSLWFIFFFCLFGFFLEKLTKEIVLRPLTYPSHNPTTHFLVQKPPCSTTRCSRCCHGRHFDVAMEKNNWIIFKGSLFRLAKCLFLVRAQKKFKKEKFP